jgi:inorganic triphosphatase YgiF
VPAVSEERELKLIAPPGLQLPAIAGAVPGVSNIIEEAPLDLSATYYDSPDFRLMRHGITLRHRFGEESGPVWTVKLPVDGDDTLRGEVNFPGNTPYPPNEVRDLVTGVLNGSNLEPVAELKTKRRRWLLRNEAGGELAELVDDRVSILEGSLIKGTFREIEIEARDAGAEHLEEIASVIERAGARPEQRSKASRALEVLHPSAITKAPAVNVSPDDPAEQAIGPAFSRALRYILQHDPHARLNEVEGVHGMRVGARRLRSAFRTFGPMLDRANVEPAIEELRWLGGLLGDVRDLDVLIEHVSREANSRPKLMPAVSVLEQRRDSKRLELAGALASQRYVELITAVRVLSESEWSRDASAGACREAMPQLVLTDWRKLKQTARKLAHDSAEPQFHRARILAKRTRYAAETVNSFTDSSTSKRLKDFARQVEVVQTVLGEHQDAAVAAQTLQAIAGQFETDGAVSFELGRLVERENQRARTKRDEFFSVWRKLDKKKHRRWLQA